MADEDEEDPVIHEVDVFLAKALAERLFLFQYPVRPSCLTYDHTANARARIKPKQQKVELELGLDVQTNTYCIPRGEQIAYAVDEAAPPPKKDQPPKEKYYPSGLMDKQVLSSVQASANASRYVAGVFKNEMLHLTPIHGVVQLRPSFEYLDQAEENSKKNAATETEKEEEEEEEAKPVYLRFAGPQTDKSKERKLQSFKHIEQKLAEEPWINMDYHQTKSRNASQERMLLYCHQLDFESPEFTTTSREYLKVLAPKPEGEESHTTALPHGVLSMTQLKGMDLPDRIKALLVNAKVIEFTHLMALLGMNTDEKAVLRGLHEYAMLVQGCWVVKSEVLYPKDSKSQVNGLDAEKLWPARDYVMWCFNNKRLLERKDVVCVIRIPSEELRDVLEQMARQKPPHGWEFMMPTDVDFLYKYQDVVKSQMVQWKNKFRSLIDLLHITKEIPKDDFILPGLDVSLHTKMRVSKPRTKKSSVSDRSGTDDEKPTQKKKLTEASPRVRKKSGSISKDITDKDSKTNVNKGTSDTESKPRILNQEISTPKRTTVKEKEFKERTTDMKSPTSEPSTIPNGDLNLANIRIKDEPMDIDEMIERQINITDVELGENLSVIEMIVDDEIDLETQNVQISLIDKLKNNSVVNNEAAFIPPAALGKRTVSDKPPSEIFKQELEKFVKETLKGGCLSLAEFKKILELRQQESGNILCSGVPDSLLEETILKVGAIQLDVKWPDNIKLDSQHRKVYARTKVGDNHDKWRAHIFTMFRDSFVLTKKSVCAYLNTATGSAPTNHIFPRFMGEFCEKYNRGWYLHGTYNAAYPDR